MKKWILFLLAILFTLVLTACGDGNDQEGTDEPATETDGTAPKDTEGSSGVEETNPPSGESATDGEGVGTFVTVDLINTDGDVVGTAELTQEDKGVLVKVNAEGLDEGDHGLHFHEFGKCDAPDFATAGEHFNPTTADHGSHAGDLPNLTVDGDGKAQAEFTAENVTLESGAKNSLFKEGGTALVIHENADDGSSQPSGDSGKRIACGVVKH
ncbi:superoxide dismutase family protein [Chungangia koreensis]|uniref:Superoxide dismutase [Cu-Zn] n=1 Tax=Chungangia koreensis TaxID=752657 RepID=A0ABV8X2I9_9LACT